MLTKNRNKSFQVLLLLKTLTWRVKDSLKPVLFPTLLLSEQKSATFPSMGPLLISSSLWKVERTLRNQGLDTEGWRKVV